MTPPPWTLGPAATGLGALLIVLASWANVDLIEPTDQFGRGEQFALAAAQWVGYGGGVLLAAGLLLLCWTALSAGSARR